ncbi:MAG: hypothetical protein WC876_01965 [Candidatus Thermoplasmatota archaeon]|jgi:hypothetical protein
MSIHCNTCRCDHANQPAELATLRAEVEALKAERDGAEITASNARSDRDSLAQRLAEAEGRAQRLTMAIDAQLKRCHCHGTGRVDVPCPFCGDSTYDHECPTESRECENCKPLRAALAAPEGAPTAHIEIRPMGDAGGALVSTVADARSSAPTALTEEDVSVIREALGEARLAARRGTHLERIVAEALEIFRSRRAR